MSNYDKALEATRHRLKAGDYDGTDIINAWMAIDIHLKERQEIADTRKKLLQEIRQRVENLSKWDIYDGIMECLGEYGRFIQEDDLNAMLDSLEKGNR